MVVAIIEKITEKSPLHFSVVRNANVFDPISMTTLETVELRANMRNLLTHIVALKIISATLAERALPRYSNLLTALTQHDSEKVKSFDCDDTRLDHFFFNEFSFRMPTELQIVVKQILVPSHGQAIVERGFNVNKSVLKVDMNGKSVVSRKLIIGHMQ